MWEDENENENYDFNWVIEKLGQNQIKNQNIDEFYERVRDPETLKIDLSKHVLVNLCYHGDHKCLTFLQLLGKQSHRMMLQGLHYVKLYTPYETPKMFWVQSLTNLRRNTFGATDRLSFERSTFLVDHETHQLIRMKTIRAKLDLPSFENQSVSQKKGKGKKSQITLRTQRQLKHGINQLFTSYVRDLQLHYSTDVILDLFQQDLMTCSATLT